MDCDDFVDVRKMLARSHIKGRHECHPETPMHIVVLDLSGDVCVGESLRRLETVDHHGII
eukprot:12379409-Prorocentrum_lima.AAC.1